MTYIKTRKTPTEKAEKDASTPQPKKNPKGEVISWSMVSKDGDLLKLLISNENISSDMTAGQVRKRYPMFAVYQYATFNSALKNARKSFQKEITARCDQTGRGGENGNIKAFPSNYEEDDDDEDGTYALSKMSVADDEFTYDTFSIGGGCGGKGVTFGASQSIQYSSAGCSRVSGVAPSASKSTGSALSCALPFLVDYWHDVSSNKRASIQVQMLSANNETLRRVTYRVASSQKEFVITVPVSQYSGRPEKAHYPYLLDGLCEEDAGRQKEILKWHPKVNARKLSLRSNNKKNYLENTMEFRIPLNFKVSLNFASVVNHDPFFYGDKFVCYPDGSVHLHVELVVETSEENMRGGSAHSPIFLVPDSVDIPSVSDESGSYMEETATTSGKSRLSSSSRASKSTRGGSRKSVSSSPRSTTSKKSTSSFSVNSSSRRRSTSVAGSRGSKRKLRKTTAIILAKDQHA